MAYEATKGAPGAAAGAESAGSDEPGPGDDVIDAEYEVKDDK